MVNNNLLAQYNQLRQNPMAILSRRYKLPPNMNFSSADSIVQYLMNTGQISQQEFNQKYNQANQLAKYLH